MGVMDLYDIRDKVALVTGGAAGIGVWMAEALTETGAKVVISGRGRHGNVHEIAKRISSEFKGECMGIVCDVSKKEQITNLVDKIIEKHGKIDILINNAGTTWGTPSQDMKLEDWQKVIDVNLTGAFLVAQAVGKQMINKKEGVILNISSVWSIRGAAWGAIGYAASKAGLNGLTRQLAIEWAPHNIRVNAICLSWFPSGMSDYFIKNFKRLIIKATPLKRIGAKDDLVGVVLAFISDATKYVTGQTLGVDAGTSVAMQGI